MFTITEGIADQITLPNGKLAYTGAFSLKSAQAREMGLEVKGVRYRGCCISSGINDRAHDSTPFPIEIDGVDIYTFIDRVATDEEIEAALPTQI